MLTIRLQRVGRKNQPIFRIVLAEKHRAAQKKIVENLGLYNPRNKEFTVKEERVKHWLEKRTALSPTVHNLFVTKKLIEGKKIQAWRPRKKPAVAGGAEQAGAASVPVSPSPQPSPTQGEEVKTEAVAESREQVQSETSKPSDKPSDSAEPALAA